MSAGVGPGIKIHSLKFKVREKVPLWFIYVAKYFFVPSTKRETAQGGIIKEFLCL